MKYTTLSKAIAYTLAGGSLTLGAISDATASATTMYNLTTAYGAPCATAACVPKLGGGVDGWLYGFGGSSNGTDTSIAAWAGTTGSHKTPFGYTGAHLNWGLSMTGYDSAEISSADAFTRYGVHADIDTAKGAWSDAVTGDTNDPNDPAKHAAGWRHDLEFGLFKSDIDARITLSASGVNQSGTQFGFTIFQGMSTNADYYHHGLWNSDNNIYGLTQYSLPDGWTTFAVGDIVAYSVGGATPSNLNTISFDVLAGQVYTIVLGGYRNGGWGDTIDGYKLSVTSAPPSSVPVPGAVWLFGTALVGYIGVQRRKRSV
ncbi:hypothetical protein [Methylomonas sp. UP202]|uniref:hypothetical protein n=1 Tax=Methylomonas sp. UP202 TaxID=3040943 RepID=UPI002478F6BE|nr:hypothetical protein [Methylomonas sp. UP202]WGS84805.1 hypothetical protein QC632_17310 [Methylomonas sp. UP202]